MLYQNFQMNPAISLILCLLVQAMAPLALAGDSCARPQDEIERCLIMLKPDAVERGLVGELVARFERKGFKLAALKFILADSAILEKHYEEHAGKSFFAGLVEFMKRGPVVPMVWQGPNIVQISRMMLGATDPVNSLPGTIRGDFGQSKQENLVHVSDSVESAKREIDLWFSQDELHHRSVKQDSCSEL